MTRLIAFLFAVICTAIQVQADKLSVYDVTLECHRGVIQIGYQFETANEYSGYQLVLELPEGVATIKDGNNAPIFTKGDCYDSSYTLSSNYFDGTDRFVALSLSSIPMTGTEGLLLSIPVVCDKSLPVGTTLEAKLSNISFGNKDGVHTVNMDDVVFNIVVGEPWITLDENAATLPPTIDEEVEVLVKRTISANQWCTICLPFALTEDQVYDAFGDDVKLAEFIEYEVNDDVTQIKVMFESALLEEDGMMSNYTYIIKTSKDISEFKVTAILTPNEDDACVEYDNGKKGSRREVYGTFYGTLKAGYVLPEYSIFMSGGNFWYSAGKSKIKAFRGFFDFVDTLESLEAASRQMTLSVWDDATSIETVPSGKIGDSRCYDLQGRVVKQPVKGIFILDGKKIFVK